MVWLPIAQTMPQYEDLNGLPAVGYVLKFYSAGTSTNIMMATDNTGGTQISDVVLDSKGNPSVSGSPFIPHLEESYKIAFYPNQASADLDTSAIWSIDNITPAAISSADSDELVKISASDTTGGYLNGKAVAGTGITLTENNSGANESLTFAVDSAPKLIDNNGIDALLVVTTASAVNEITVINAATGNGPAISATGDDANIDLSISAKGTGDVNLNSDVVISGGTTVGGNIVSDTDSTDDLGETGVRFANAFVDLVTTDGVKFPATQVASADANTLDDYEEGTFNVTLTAGTGTITINSFFDTLAYTKIGNKCHVQGEIIVSSVSTPSGVLSIGSLPFTSAALPEAAHRTRFAVFGNNFSVSADGFKAGEISTGSTSVFIADSDGTVFASEVITGSTFYFNFSYITE